MKNMKKILTMMGVIALTAAIAIGGTLAYLTSTATVTNTFTVGQVKITLDEAKVGSDGKALTGNDAARVAENSYKLFPGHTYDKDPTIHVDATSEDCYIRAKVTLTNADKWIAIAAKYADGKVENIIKGTDDNLWWVSAPAVNENDNTMTYTFVYKNETKDVSLQRVWQSSDGYNLELFNEIAIPGGLTNEEIKGVANTQITVVAEAIQADGFVENSNDEAKAVAAYNAAMAALDGAQN